MKFRSILLALAASLLTGVLVSQAQVPGVNSSLNTIFTMVYEASTMKPTYSASSSITSTSTTGGEICAISGSSTKQIRVRRVILGGTLAAVETLPVSFMKRSSAYAAVGATGSQPTKVPYDASSAAATAVVEVWTAAPTVGTLVGALADVFQTFPNTTTGIGDGAITYSFGQLGQPVVLRSTTQWLGVNFSNTLNTGVLSCTFEWTEE